MKIKLGDKVQSLGGVEGEIISLSKEPYSVMIKVPGVWRGSGVVSIPLARLKFISDYSVDETSFSTPDVSAIRGPDDSRTHNP